MSSPHKHLQTIYEIQVKGELGHSWETCFDALTIRRQHGGGQLPTTILVGPVADQAALRGMLCKLWDLNLTLISVRCIEVESE